ncbi:hypothetical protein MMPV_001202 [Pyropia vietnamensis]
MAFVCIPLSSQTAASAGAVSVNSRSRRPARGGAALQVATPFLSRTAAAAVAAGRRPARTRSSTGRRGPAPLTATLGALLFDCDGVLADTERDAHRPSFNAAFAEAGLPDEWSEELYGRLLETGGGKERMTAYWNEAGREWPASAPDDASRVALVKHLHARKTALFSDVVATGAVPLRPGVARLITEALDADVLVAVCSTSNELAVQQIVNMLGADIASRIPVFAGDVVAAKKPAPDVYLLAAEKLGVDPAECAVVEDSAIGLAAGLAAGMRVLVTVSTYTGGEAFSGAARVVDDLDAGGVDLAAVREMMA